MAPAALLKAKTAQLAVSAVGVAATVRWLTWVMAREITSTHTISNTSANSTANSATDSAFHKTSTLRGSLQLCR